MSTSVPVPSQASNAAYSFGGGGVTPLQQFLPVISERDPTDYDTKYNVGQTWINRTDGNYWVLGYLSSISGSVLANWEIVTSADGNVQEFEADSGTAVPSSGIIDLAGTSDEITTTASGNTVTFSIPSTFVAPGSISNSGNYTIGTSQATNNATVGAGQTTGTIYIGGTGAATGAIYIANGTGAQTVDIANGTGGKTVNISTGTGASAVTIGSTTALASTVIQAGTGGLTVAGSAACSIVIGATAQTGNIYIGESSATSTTTLGGGSGNTTITINAGAGTNTTNIANNGSAVNTVVIGSGHTTSSTTLQAGTGSVVISSGQVVQVTATAASTYDALGTDYFIAVDPTSNTVNVVLPSSPSKGQSYYVYDATGEAASHTITITGNGANISAAGTSASTKTLTAAYSSMYLVFNGTIWNGRYST